MSITAKSDTLKQLRVRNELRQNEWGGKEYADLAFRGLEFAGESGEFCEAVKKYLRAERGITGNAGGLDEIKQEAGDVIITLDLICKELGIDLRECVAGKFDQTSRKYGLSTMFNG